MHLFSFETSHNIDVKFRSIISNKTSMFFLMYIPNSNNQLEMSAQEVRNEIIRENLPKLIKDLTGFEDDDENIRHCEHFAWSIVRNHRNLSTNSHEVKRKIEGIQEKFTVDNCQQYADYLGLLCDEIIRHPLCLEHYEVDVHWSLLDFLLTLAYNPTGALKKNKYNIDLNRKKVAEETHESETSFWKNVLKEDFIPLEPYGGSNSDLSDWSDDSSCADLAVLSSVPKCHESVKFPSKISANSSTLQNIQPPTKQKHYIEFDNNRSQDYLFEHVQNTWWLRCAKHLQAPIHCERYEANFASVYSGFLSETSNNLIRFKEPSTVSELCLMRELLWMFHSPENCKFFNMNSNREIQVRANVSIPSITVNGLSNFLGQHFLPYIRMMNSLRSFLDFIYADYNPPKTLECYAANLRSMLTPIWQVLLDYESRLLAEKDFEICTVMHLQANLKNSLRMLESIYEVHSQAVLNLNQYPAHIASSYLLASLMHSNEIASCATEANLAISLFLTSIKIFCIIIDTWWTEGRLDDWQQEFLVERSTLHSDQTISVRQFEKNKEKSFFVPSNISKMITENICFRLLLEHSLEAGCTLNLLYEINRMGDLKNACEAIEGKLYNVFIDDVMKYTKKLQSQVTPKPEPTESESDIKHDIKTENKNEVVLNSLTTTDEFLLMAFASNAITNNVDEIESQGEKPELNAFDIWQQLMSTKDVILPLEEVVLTSLTRILKTRIAFANNFVMKLYREEFDILKHLGNIRKVLLLEASDLMYQFYFKLFKNIESGHSWANPFLLTVHLDDIICSKFPEMSSCFRLEINSSYRCQTNKVFEAVEELTVTYNFSRELSLIITEEDIQQYNKVFRFLLKVKWGLITLENLQFPRSHKRRIPYANFEMIDLLMRRLEQLRFWMIYAIQSIHFHLMTHVLQSMGEQLDEKIINSTNLKEMVMVHKSYVSTVCEHCFLVDNCTAIKLGVEQLLNLAYILRLEWNSCIKHIESNNPLAVDMNNSISDDCEQDYVVNSQIDAIELTYIRCHQYLANRLNNEVYLKQKTFLSGLSAAFNTSLPY